MSGLEKFKEILIDARDAGPQIVAEWLEDPKKFLNLGRYTLPIHELLKSLSAEEKQKLLPIAEEMSRSSFYQLIKYLEEGDSGVSFDLTIIDDQTGEAEQLIGSDIDNELAYFVR